MKVNLFLVGGSELKKCNIYSEEVKTGDTPYSTEEDIGRALQKVPWGKKLINVQSKDFNAILHVNSIKKYAICES